MDRLGWILTTALLCLGVASAQDVSINVQSQMVNEGDSIVLVCTHTGGLSMDWDHNGFTLQNGQDRVSITEETDATENTKVSTLTRSGVVATDSGTYKCMDQVDFFDVYDEAEVVVSTGGGDMPGGHITIEPAEDFVHEAGKPAMFSCTCSMGSQLTWYHDDKAMSEGPGVTINEMTEGTAKTTALTLDSVTVLDSGTYSCRGASGEGPQVTMTVHGGDVDQDGEESEGPVNISPLESSELDEDMPLNMQCECASCSELNWFLDGEKIEEEVGVTITVMEQQGGTRMSMLSIDAVGPENAGTYSCQDEDGNHDEVDLKVNGDADEDGHEEGQEGDDDEHDDDEDSAADGLLASVILVAFSGLRHFL